MCASNRTNRTETSPSHVIDAIQSKRNVSFIHPTGSGREADLQMLIEECRMKQESNADSTASSIDNGGWWLVTDCAMARQYIHPDPNLEL